MGIVRATAGAIGGSLADSWLDFIEADNMTDTTAMTRGVQVQTRKQQKTVNRHSIKRFKNNSRTESDDVACRRRKHR